MHTYMTLHLCSILRQRPILCRTLCQNPYIKNRVLSLEFVFPSSGFCLLLFSCAKFEVSGDVVEGGFLHADWFVMDGPSSNGLPSFV